MRALLALLAAVLLAGCGTSGSGTSAKGSTAAGASAGTQTGAAAIAADGDPSVETISPRVVGADGRDALVLRSVLATVPTDRLTTIELVEPPHGMGSDGQVWLRATGPGDASSLEFAEAAWQGIVAAAAVAADGRLPVGGYLYEGTGVGESIGGAVSPARPVVLGRMRAERLADEVVAVAAAAGGAARVEFRGPAATPYVTVGVVDPQAAIPGSPLWEAIMPTLEPSAIGPSFVTIEAAGAPLAALGLATDGGPLWSVPELAASTLSAQP